MVSSSMGLKTKHHQPFTAVNRLLTVQPCCTKHVFRTSHSSPVVHASGLPPSSNDSKTKSSSRQPQVHDTPKQLPLSSKLRRLGGKGPNGPPPPSGPTQLQQLAGHAAYTGFMGTLAVVAANALGIDLWAAEAWQWTNVHDLQLAVVMISPLLVANLVLLGPDWADWKLPDLTPEEVAAERAAACAQEAAEPSTSTADTRQQQLAPATGSGRGGQSTTNMMVPANVWGMLTQPGTQLPSSWRVFRDAANLAQGNYVANNPTAGINPVAELGVAAVDSLTSEMLFRGVLITLVTVWLRDRLYEAGWSDLVAVPPFVASLITGLDAGSTGLIDSAQEVQQVASMVPLDDIARWGAGVGLLVMLSALAARRVGRAAKKVAMMNDVRSRIATVHEKLQQQQKAKGAAAAASTKSAADASISNTIATTSQPASSDVKSTQASSSAQSPMPGPAFDSTGNSGVVADDVSPKGMVGSSLPRRHDTEAASTTTQQHADGCTADTASNQASSTQQPPQPSTPHAAQPLPGAESGQLGGSPASGAADKEVKGPQMLAVALAGDQLISATRDPSTAFNAVVWSTALQASRDLLQSGTLSMLFVATGGNLATCFLASLANQAVFSALQRVGRERTRKRSAVLAKELADFNAKLQAIANKRKQKGAAAGSQQPTSNSQATAANISSTHTAPDEANSPQQSAVIAASAAPVVGAPAKAAVTLEEVQSRKGVARTLGMLDLLVPDTPASSQPGQTAARAAAQEAASAKQQ